MTTPNDDAQAYRDLLEAVTPLYTDRRYVDALRLVRDAAAALASHRADTAHLAACLLCLDGDARGAYDELRRAFDEGEWWDRCVLEDDDDLATARALPQFATLVAESDRRTQAAQGAPPPAPVVDRPTRPPTAVLVALHGAGQDGRTTAPLWHAAVDDGLLVVAPTSSRRTTPAHRTWPDLLIGGHDVEQALLQAEAPADVPHVLGGFSAGGRQAMLMTLTADPEAPERFLVVNPALGHVEVDPGTTRRAGGRGVRGHVLLGADDEAYDAVTAAVAQLNDGGVRTTLDVVEGLAHAYPGDFATRLHAALPGLLSGPSG
jgi:predicted esterase